MISAAANSVFGLSSVVTLQGRHVAIRSSKDLNQSIAKAHHEHVGDFIEDRQAAKAEQAEKSDSDQAQEAPAPEQKPSKVINLTDKALRSLLEGFRQVDTSKLNFKDGVIFATWNFPAAANGPQIAAMSKGIHSAIKAKFEGVQGVTWRELSDEDVFHEHGILHFPEGVDVEAFESFLFERLKHYSKKQDLSIAKTTAKTSPVHCDRILTLEHWNAASEYAGKKEKQYDRKRACLPQGGSWVHKFQALPRHIAKSVKLIFGSQYYALLALTAHVTGRDPKDFRQRNLHIDDQDLQARIVAIAKVVGELEVPWEIPTGVEQGEHEALIITDLDGKPSILQLWYGDYRTAKMVEVGVSGLREWGAELARRYGLPGQAKETIPAPTKEAQALAPAVMDEEDVEVETVEDLEEPVIGWFVFAIAIPDASNTKVFRSIAINLCDHGRGPPLRSQSIRTVFRKFRTMFRSDSKGFRTIEIRR